MYIYIHIYFFKKKFSNIPAQHGGELKKTFSRIDALPTHEYIHTYIHTRTRHGACIIRINKIFVLLDFNCCRTFFSQWPKSRCLNPREFSKNFLTFSQSHRIFKIQIPQLQLCSVLPAPKEKRKRKKQYSL